jgi:hypothetical protein
MKDLGQWLGSRGKQIETKMAKARGHLNESAAKLREFLSGNEMLKKIAKVLGVALLALLIVAVVGTFVVGTGLMSGLGGGR